MDIEGKRVLITGAGSGIGRAAARRLAEKGAAEILLVDRSAQGNRETASLVREIGARAVTCEIDIGNALALEALFADANTGALDILFNNAGILSGEPRFPDMPATRVETVVAVNLTAVLLGTQFAASNMRRHARRGVIINTASNVALTGGRKDPVYVATKAGVLMFTRSCVDLFEEWGIRVNAVLPAVTDTPMLGSPGDRHAPAAWNRAALKGKRMLQPDDIVSAMIRLVEDDRRFCDFEVIENPDIEMSEPAGGNGAPDIDVAAHPGKRD